MLYKYLQNMILDPDRRMITRSKKPTKSNLIVKEIRHFDAERKSSVSMFKAIFAIFKMVRT